MHIARIITNKTFKKLLKRIRPTIKKNYGELKQQQQQQKSNKKNIETNNQK